VGVKIYVGHEGKPCPRSSAALQKNDGFDRVTDAHPRISTENVEGMFQEFGKIAEQFQTTKKIFIMETYKMFSIPDRDWNQRHRDILGSLIKTFGVEHVDLIRNLREAITQAEKEADEIQAHANEQAAEREAKHPRNTTFNPLTADIPITEEIADENDEWEDEDMFVKGQVPRFLPQPPTRDGAGNDFVTIAHTNGFHSIPIVWCNCDAEEERDLQLLDIHLYPVTYKKTRTLFTFSCLDDYWAENLECKTSHYLYHQKLRRLTCGEYLNGAPNRASSCHSAVAKLEVSEMVLDFAGQNG